jgi:ABC-2 type transport system ATP-binding protein
MTAALRLRGAGKDYGARTAVGAIDLEVHRGECFALLGPNGAGKTTTISMAAGVVTPSRGEIQVGGIDLVREPFRAKALLGLVPQEIALYEELSALQNLRFFGALYGLGGAMLARRIEEALEIVGLRDRAREPAARYSGGMKRRLNIAAGLLHRPEVLILDEPTVGVDPQSRNHIFATVRALRDAGTTVIYTTHYMGEVEALCDRIAIIDAGAIVASGTVRELVSRHASQEVEIEIGGESAAVDTAVRAACAAGATRDGGAVVRIVPTVFGAVRGSIEDTHEATALVRIVPTAGLAPVISAIEGAGAVVVRIASRAATLEAAFLELTGHALRDAS